MIYTVTFNPALDYVVRLAAFEPGRINRTEQRGASSWAARASMSPVYWGSWG